MLKNCLLVWGPTPNTRIVKLVTRSLVGVREVEFPRMALAHGNMWSGKRKDDRARDEEPLIAGWPRGHRWYGVAAVLQSVSLQCLNETERES